MVEINDEINNDIILNANIKPISFESFSKIIDLISYRIKEPINIQKKKILYYLMLNSQMTPNELAKENYTSIKRQTLYDHIKILKKYDLVGERIKLINILGLGRPNIFWFLKKRFFDLYNSMKI